MDDKSFSNKVKRVIELSREKAIRLGHDYVGVEHLMLGILSLEDSMAFHILETLNCNPVKIKQDIEDAITIDYHSTAVGNLPITSPS